jgi:hypothetical protein
VAELLSRIEEYALERTGAHSRTPEEYDYEFQEGLASGIEKHGAAIELRKNVTPYQLSMIPSGVPDRLLVGSPGDKETFRELLAALLPVIADDLTVTSILWNSPRTRDIAREWGLIFVHRRVQEARLRPEPVRENPTLAVQEYPENVTSSPSTKNVTSSPSTKKVTPDTFLSSAELESVSKRKTFIDTYLAASASKGFMNPAYSTPAAWTALSMAFGLKAFISKGVAIGMNMWFLSLGMSGTGKSADFKFAKHVLDNMLRDGEGYYNLGAHSSPEGLHVELLTRDGKPSMIYHDEASSFFAAMKTKDWMQSLEYHFSDWYMGDVEPSNKLSLKELRGKSARTSFNIHMIATPDRLMELIDTPMFATGFLARYNWTWAEPPTESDLRYESTQSEHDAEKGAPTVTFGLAGDLLHAGYSVGHDPVSIWGTPTATARLAQAFKEFDLAAKSHEKYAAMEPAITRLGRETMWKCAALLALYDGRTIFTLDDALVAVAHAAQWYRNLVRVVEATSESEFAGDVSEIEAYVKSQGGSVSQARLMHRFRNMIRFSPRELDDRISFLTSSGRFNKVEKDRRVIYELNGVAD